MLTKSSDMLETKTPRVQKKGEAKKNQRLNDAKRWPRLTTPIMVRKTSCKLLCAFEVKVCNKYIGSLAINFLALADIKALSL